MVLTLHKRNKRILVLTLHKRNKRILVLTLHKRNKRILVLTLHKRKKFLSNYELIVHVINLSLELKLVLRLLLLLLQQFRILVSGVSSRGNSLGRGGGGGGYSPSTVCINQERNEHLFDFFYRENLVSLLPCH